MEWSYENERKVANTTRLRLRTHAAMLRYFAGGEPEAGMGRRTEELLSISRRMSELADELDAYLGCPGPAHLLN